MIDIVNTLKDKAELKGWIPVIGAKNIQSYTLSQKDLTTGKSALMIDLPTSSAIISNGTWSEHTYNIELLLVRKFEEFTKSSVSETTEQKYNNRLFELQEDFDTFLYEVFQCAGVSKVTSINYSYVMNILSKSVDGVLCTIRFEA